jgi:arylsulfatase A-like enzyme
VLNARAMLGTHDVLMVTLDTLRFDVAQELSARGETPHLTALLPGGAWQRRHAPANFTYAAHCAFFAGFLPTPASPGKHERLFAVAFPGSETTSERTLAFDAPDIVHGFADAGYRTICVGGTGFFNLRSPLGRVLPGMFDEAAWEERFGVTSPRSTEHQVDFLTTRLAELPGEQRVFAFLNVSALHQPNRFYAEADDDDRASHAAALRYVDGALAPLFDAFRARAPTLVTIFSDHGTAYGEDGYTGHRLNHPVVGDVPYAELVLEAA